MTTTLERLCGDQTADFTDLLHEERHVVRQHKGYEHYVIVRQRRDGAKAGRAVLVYCHGGGFIHGDPDAHRDLQRYLAWRYDLVVVSTSYDLKTIPRYPGEFRWCADAVRWTRAEAGTLGIDAKRVALSGSSAGAYHTGMVCCTHDDPDLAGGDALNDQSARPDAAVLMWGPMDFVARYHGQGGPNSATPNLLGCTYPEDPKAYHLASVVTRTRPDLPPALFVQGRNDQVVHLAQGELGHAAWKRAGAESDLQLYDYIGHGRNEVADNRACLRDVGNWLAQRFGLKPVDGTAAP